MHGYTNSVQRGCRFCLFVLGFLIFLTFQTVFPAAGLSGVPFAFRRGPGEAQTYPGAAGVSHTVITSLLSRVAVNPVPRCSLRLDRDLLFETASRWFAIVPFIPAFELRAA